jgi:hypothetical protein
MDTDNANSKDQHSNKHDSHPANERTDHSHGHTKDGKRETDKAKGNPQPPWAKLRRAWTYACSQEIATGVMALSTLVMAVFTIMIFAATAINVWVAARQWEVAREGANIARDSLVSVQRAFVTFHGFTNIITPRTKPKSKEFWLVEAVWENLGSTPARVLAHRFSIRKLPDEPAGETFRGQAGNFTMVGSVIGPKATLSAGPVTTPEPYVLPSLPEKLTGTYVIRSDQQTFFWGWIAYRDVFPNTKPHVSEFCSYLGAVILGHDPNTGASMQFKNSGCKRHNCTDDDCDDYHEIVGMLPK